MIYFTHYIPWNDDSRMTSGVKGIEDIETIFCRNGARLLPIPSKRRTHHLTPARRLALQRPILRTWQEACGPLLPGDALVILLPLHEKFGLLGRLIRSLKSRGIKIVFLAADLELARPATYSGLKRSYVTRQELSYLRQADGIITHNQAYTRLLQSRGITGPFMEFGLFDYLIPEAQLRNLQSRRNGGTPLSPDAGSSQSNDGTPLSPDVDPGQSNSGTPLSPDVDPGQSNSGTPLSPDAGSGRLSGGTPRPDGPVIIATNLNPEKAGYAYRLPAGTDFVLYGPNYRPELQRSDGASGGSGASERRPEDRKSDNAPFPRITYGGAFQADDLIDHISGSYGLLWDGPSPDTCAGPYGSYMRVNTPHRISLFLACGIPVIVWDQSAMAPLVLEEGLGFAVSSLGEIPAKRMEISAEQYSEMAKKAWLTGARLRRGENTASILEQIRQL
ncbi:MAG: hypothetical protein I3I98_08060 [Mobilibacterium timonense]|uniref:hypothetical protein n=1 Tax=Mobilibacterium timonense TaxID=1871012 RepID=UPI0023552388|nr:hypothetical protein [Mobilibacterium timonense]MBM6991327.1 hypothetical protein [Mobilibacterium timonense]